MTDVGATIVATPKVLIADDDPSIVSLLALRCTNMGFAVQTATNGLQALFMAQKNPPDVVIVDVNMPELDGLSLCLRLLDSAKKGIDAIVVTGYADQPELEERCGGLGATYARKGPDLWRAVEAALCRKFPAMTRQERSRQSRPLDQVRDRPRVLVVDDDADVGSFLGTRLRKAGVEPVFAASGLEGFRMARRERPSAIITDFVMPDGDALFLLRRLRSIPATERIPLIVLTAHRLDAPTRAVLQNDISGRPGAAALLAKPPDIQELFTALQRYCHLTISL